MHVQGHASRPSECVFRSMTGACKILLLLHGSPKVETQCKGWRKHCLNLTLKADRIASQFGGKGETE